jgi:hypothetical protein
MLLSVGLILVSRKWELLQVRRVNSSAPDGTPCGGADVTGRARLVDPGIRDAHPRCAHAHPRCTQAYIACATGLVDPGIHDANPRRTNAAGDARPRCADTNARVYCGCRTGQAHDHGAQQQYGCITL